MVTYRGICKRLFIEVKDTYVIENFAQSVPDVLVLAWGADADFAVKIAANVSYLQMKL